ncbi:tRNA 2-thiouridine(34) synthase MnmA [Candidatus Berkelbacteria bacterium]|nr:tRNA 2-thiouridine(34) synthase MnmA [Candidatus Berkelbacteria bacterium]
MSARQRYIVGLSGGVDSALSAALLVEAGHEVHGVYLKAWNGSEVGYQRSEIRPDEFRFAGSCPWKDDIADARRVAAHLGIPFTVIDVHEAYRARVVDVMLAEYAAGRTPNPDILCNREMKFGLLVDLVNELQYDAVATGHYARVNSEQSGVSSRGSRLPLTVHYSLERATDERKDQTYFLWTLTQDQLRMIRFPIGHLTKPEVRVEAQRRNLPVADKRDSQGICFLGPVELRRFLVASLATEPGDVVDRAGNVVGTHQGAPAYTIGQRHGFDVRSTTCLAGRRAHESRTHYVVEKDIERNRLIVDTKPPITAELTATELSWIGAAPSIDDRLEARIRHGQVPQPATIKSINHESAHMNLCFEEPQLAVASGQSVVFSDGSRILGGGIIATR